MLRHPELVAALCKPGKDIVATLTPETAHALHMAIGISGEVDELVEACLNHDAENMVEELGDVEFYAEGLRQALDVVIDRRVYSLIPENLTLQLIVAKGHILDECKKLAIYNDGKRWATLGEALAYFYKLLDLFYLQTNIDRDAALTGNIDKLSVRYADMKYSDTSAQERADKE